MLWNNFSYVVPDRLAGMRRPGVIRPLDEDMDLLMQEGIRAIISLTEDPLDTTILEAKGLDYLHLPVADFFPPTLEQVIALVDFIETKNLQGKPVVVHCWAGVGRTGTMLACYLVKMGLSPEQAIQQIRSLRPGSVETQEQMDIVEEYAQYLRG